MDSDSSLDPSQPIILFDGVCNLCNSSVNFIIDHDPGKIFKFTSLQSETGQKILTEFQDKPMELNSVVLYQNDQIYLKSTAALKIAGKMSGLWFLMGIFWIVPPIIRNLVYDFIARNRYQWFGKMDACRMPTPELKDRFI